MTGKEEIAGLSATEQEMMARISKMEGQVKSWVDGLLDLNERMRKFQSEHVEEFELLQQMERNTKKGDAFWGKMRDVMDTIEQRLKEMETYKSGHELYHRDSLDVRIDLIYKLLDEVKKHMETNRAKGGWDVSGGENT